MQTRINLNYRPLSRLSMDLKVLPWSSKGHKFILCIIDEVTNYLITIPRYQSKAEEIGDALIKHIVIKYCVPDCIIMDQDSTFMSSLMNYLFDKLGIVMSLGMPYFLWFLANAFEDNLCLMMFASCFYFIANSHQDMYLIHKSFIMNYTSILSDKWVKE